MLKNKPDIPKLGLTKFYLAMPDQYKTDDVVESYRKYYINEKQRDKSGKWMMFYTKRDIPKWFPDSLLLECQSKAVLRGLA